MYVCTYVSVHWNVNYYDALELIVLHGDLVLHGN